MAELVKKTPPGVNVFFDFEEQPPVILRPVMEAAVVAQAFFIAKDPAPVAGVYSGVASDGPIPYPGLPAEAEVDDFSVNYPGEPNLLDEVFVLIEDSADDFDVTEDDQVVITAAGVAIAKCLQVWNTILSGTIVTTEEGLTRLTFPSSVDVHALGVRIGDRIRFATNVNELIDPASSTISAEVDPLTGLAQDFDIIGLPSLNAVDVAILGSEWAGFIGETNVQVEVRRYPAGTGVLIEPDGDGAGTNIPASDTLVIVNPNVNFLADPVQPGDLVYFTSSQDEIVGDSSVIIGNALLPTTPAPTTPTDSMVPHGTGMVGINVPILTGVTFVDDDGDFITAGVNVGDYLRFIQNESDLQSPDGVVVTKNVKDYRITARSATSLTLATRLITEAPASGKTFEYTVVRKNQPVAVANNILPFRVIAVLGTQSLQFERAMSTEARTNGREFEFKVVRTKVPVGTLRIGYRALRGDLSGVFTEVQSDATGGSTFLVSKLGQITKDNPIAVMAVLATLATTEAVGAVGLKHWAVEDFKAALDILGAQPQVYAIAAATSDPTLLSMLKAHVDKYSDPVVRKGEERYALVNYRFPDQDIVIPTVTDVDDTLNVEADRHQVTLGGNATVDFGDVLPNYILDFDPNGEGTTIPFDINAAKVERSEIRITARLSNTKIVLAEEIHVDQGSTIVPPWRILTQVRSSDELAQLIARSNNAIGDFRVVSVFPFDVGINLDGALERLPGYYACAAIAGLRCGNAASSPLSRTAVPGLAVVYGSDSRYSADQLDIMAGGGTWVLVQDGQVVVTRQQLTTDISSLVKSEDSIRTALDYGAKTFRSQLTPLMGKRNITDKFIQQELRPRCEGILAQLIAEGIFDTTSSIMSLTRDPARADRVIINARIITLKPFNQADVVFLIS
jgi:hypothetical protein